MVRRQRRWVAGLVVLGIVFAQFITVAHACALATAASQAAMTFAQPADETMPADCTAMARVAANAKICESHCAYGQQIDVHPDAPVAPMAPQSVLTVHPVQPVVQPSLETISLHARSTGPPVTLLFSRFLI